MGKILEEGHIERSKSDKRRVLMHFTIKIVKEDRSLKIVSDSRPINKANDKDDNQWLSHETLLICLLTDSTINKARFGDCQRI